MSRRRGIKKRKIQPDIKYGSELIEKFINQIMVSGKKSLARSIVYQALEQAADKSGKDEVAVFEGVLKNIKPAVEVKSRRVGGANYQVPVPVRDDRQITLAMRWLKEAALKRSEKGMVAKLVGEMLDALKEEGAAVKKRIDTKKMADANQAFAHFA